MKRIFGTPEFVAVGTIALILPVVVIVVGTIRALSTSHQGGTVVVPRIGSYARPVQDGIRTYREKKSLRRLDILEVTGLTGNGRYYRVRHSQLEDKHEDFVDAKDLELVTPIDVRVRLNWSVWGEIELPTTRSWLARGNRTSVRLTGWLSSLLLAHKQKVSVAPLKDFALAYDSCLADLSRPNRPNLMTPLLFPRYLSVLRGIEARLAEFESAGLHPDAIEHLEIYVAVRTLYLSRMAGWDDPPDTILSYLNFRSAKNFSDWSPTELCAADDLTRLSLEQLGKLVSPPRDIWLDQLSRSAARLPDPGHWNVKQAAIARAKLIHVRGQLEDYLLKKDQGPYDSQRVAASLLGLQGIIPQDGTRPDLVSLLTLAEIDVILNRLIEIRLLGRDRTIRPYIIVKPLADSRVHLLPLREPSHWTWDELSLDPTVAELRWD